MKKNLIILCATICVCGAWAKINNPWSQVKEPTSGVAQSIGDYSAGCLRGAQTLPAEGEGFQVMRLSRKRFFGHPALLNFLQETGMRIKAVTGRDVLVGDMGQPRGGPTMSGHASHQTGLDVDVWYIQPKPGQILTYRERETLGSPSMVIPEFEGLNQYWTDDHIRLLKAAAASDQVERIFVNPVIKKRICDLTREPWLQKLRPWWFHEDHFHVRLKCQAGSPQCVSQAAPPSGDGCAEVDGWFKPDAKATSHFYRTCKVGEVLVLSTGEKIKCSGPTMPKLPAECQAVLTEN